jgi:uncharacterized membrane protein YcaP (DUF421 family)
MFGPVDWGTVLAQDTPILEIFARGTLTYLGLLLLFRLTPNREAGSTARTNLLVIVLLADAAQNGMADDYRSVTAGLVLVATLIFWSVVIDWASFHFRWARAVFSSPPVRIIRHGRLDGRAMRRELLSRDELMSQLRRQGIEDVADVEEAWLEPDGELSVVPRGRPGSTATRAPG